jgi:hypothetical protein
MSGQSPPYLGGRVRSFRVIPADGEEPGPSDEQEAAATRAVVAEAIEAYRAQHAEPQAGKPV